MTNINKKEDCSIKIMIRSVDNPLKFCIMEVTAYVYISICCNYFLGTAAEFLKQRDSEWQKM